MYASGKKRYMEFCGKTATVPLPATEKQLCRFVAYLREEGLRHQTVKSYLAAVRHMQISNDMGDPKIGSMPRLELVVRGMKGEQAGHYHARNTETHTSALEGKTGRMGHCNVVGSNDPLFLWFPAGRGGCGTFRYRI